MKFLVDLISDFLYKNQNQNIISLNFKMNSFFITASFVAVFLVVVIDGASYNFLSIRCQDVNREIFQTEICTVNGTTGTILTLVERNLTKINVSCFNVLRY